MTPMQRQYETAKERHPEALLLFRMGDFYELFADDAHLAAKTLGLALTTRDKTIDMAGFPHHALESHLRKLIAAGHRVAILEPVDKYERPLGEKLVTRIVVPGSERHGPMPKNLKPAAERWTDHSRQLLLFED